MNNFYISYSRNNFSESNGSLFYDRVSHINPYAFKHKADFDKELERLQSDPNVFDIKTNPDEMIFGSVVVTYHGGLYV